MESPARRAADADVVEVRAVDDVLVAQRGIAAAAALPTTLGTCADAA
jgi:hypothetical protein